MNTKKTIRGPRAVLDKWLKDLRSGEYTQSKGKMERQRHINDNVPAGFCCLGVLVKGQGLECANYLVPTTEMLDKMGLEFGFFAGGAKRQVPEVFHEGELLMVSELNDSWGLDFKAIANLIEARMEYTD